MISSISAGQDAPAAPAQSQAFPSSHPAARDAFLKHKERSN